MLIFKSCSITREKEIYQMVKDRLEFLKQQKIRFTWPKTSIETEYESTKYIAYINDLEKKITQKDKDLIDRTLRFFNQSRDQNIVVEISNYGPMGFYNAKMATITINMNTDRDPIETIKHEIVHIMVEDYVRTYKLNHENKELLVNGLKNILNHTI